MAAIAEEDALYLVSELQEGVPLTRILSMRRKRSEPVTLVDIEPLVDQVFGALEDAGLHGCLKPNNVIVTPDLLKVTDFGLVEALGSATYRRATAADDQSLRYLAPELQQDVVPTAAADVFCLAGLIAELVTAREFSVDNVDLFAADASISSELLSVIQRALRERPQERFSTVASFVRAFRIAARARGAFSRSQSVGLLNQTDSTQQLHIDDVEFDSDPTHALDPTISSSVDLDVDTEQHETRAEREGVRAPLGRDGRFLGGVKAEDADSQIVEVASEPSMDLDAMSVLAARDARRLEAGVGRRNGENRVEAAGNRRVNREILHLSGPEPMSAAGVPWPKWVLPVAVLLSASAGAAIAAAFWGLSSRPKQSDSMSKTTKKGAFNRNDSSGMRLRPSVEPLAETGSEPSVSVRDKNGALCPSNMKFMKASSTTSAYCVDIYEAPGFGRMPQQATYAEAQSLCGSRGFRLCTSREWTRACGHRYPYGARYESSRCNTEASAVIPSGSKPSCKSNVGVFDMSGNLAEWVAEKTAMGGHFRSSGVHASCGARGIGGQRTGFRCCLSLP